jgi:hypothetical protein
MGAYEASINIMTDLLMKQTEDYVKTALQYGENSNELKDLEYEQKLQFNVTTDFLRMLMETEIKNKINF